MRGRASVALAAAALCGLLIHAGAAGAVSSPTAIGPDGTSAPVYSYANAIRERVWVEPIPAIDQDGNAVPDRVALDIMRPAETAAGLDVPVIIEPTPYATSVGLGSQGSFLYTVGNAPVRFPLFYDNYFVPRGFAVIIAQANGTSFSTGCPLHGGPGDVASMKAVIDWLQGRDALAKGYDAVVGGNQVSADWDTGKAAMIGKSYNGTLPTGVAATGVAGLTTIVPISAISRWYDYSRSNGVRFNAAHYPATLLQAVTHNQAAGPLGVVPPDRTAICTAAKDAMSAADGDASGDVNSFWSDRDYTTHMADVHASVFLSFGLNDDNVKVEQFTNWWAGLTANNVPRKLWLSQEGHVDPFDYRRAAWVDTLHRWFDYWLLDVPNGVMSQPRVTIERSTDVWEDDADWPLPGTSSVDVFLNGIAAGSAGTLGAFTGGGITDSLSFADLTTQTEAATIATPDGAQVNRRVFLSPVLRRDVHLSGVPSIDVRASFDRTNANLGALLVDYSAAPFTRPTRTADGVVGKPAPDNITCWGDSTPAAGPSPGDSACFQEMIKPTASVTSWLVSNAILDVQNRDSLASVTPFLTGTPYRLTFPLLGSDYVFPAGHRIGVILVSSYKDYSGFNATVVPAVAPPLGVSVDTRLSKIVLPIVGGPAEARKSGIFLDTLKPTLTLPSPAPVEATGAATAVSWAASASDDLDDAPAVACAPVSGAAFAVGSTTVSCTATDASGNVASGSFAVVVKDTTAPTLSLPAPIKVEADGASGGKVSYAVSATDVADPSPALSCLPASGSIFALGTTTVACSARDAAGNTAAGSFAVTVADTVPPVLTAPRTLTANATSTKGAKVSFRATASDTVDATPTVSCRPASGGLFKIGRTIVSCTASDDAANSAGTSVTIVVLGAPDQLKALRTRLAKQRGGKGLVKQVNAVLSALAGHRNAKACSALAQLKRAVPTASAKADLARIGKLMRC